MSAAARPRISSFRDLIAWQKSMKLVLEVYRATQTFPKSETYGLVSQLRRASVSIPSNIAEGHARLSTGEFKHFLGQARGSLVELETQILISEMIGYLDLNQSQSLRRSVEEVSRILNGLITSIANRKLAKANKFPLVPNP
jgi:four helix bundle protein